MAWVADNVPRVRLNRPADERAATWRIAGVRDFAARPVGRVPANVLDRWSQSEGLRSRHSTLPPGAVLFAETPDRRPRGGSGRAANQQPRPTKLSAEQRDAVRVAVGRGRTLRDVAADFGVSHETVRSIIRSA